MASDRLTEVVRNSDEYALRPVSYEPLRLRTAYSNAPSPASGKLRRARQQAAAPRSLTVTVRA